LLGDIDNLNEFSLPEVRGVSEKVLHRLEQLDFDTGSRQFYGGLTQEEYTIKVRYAGIGLTNG